MLYSLIIPVYNEKNILDELINRTLSVLESQSCDWEILMVDDGSNDESVLILREYEKKIKNFHLIELIHNYGQTVALRAGIEASKGDIIICMDGDLQHSPEDIPGFIKYIADGYDLVSGYKDASSRQGQSSIFAHLMIKLASKVDLRYFGATMKAFRREIINTSVLVGNAHRYLGVFLAQNAQRIKEVPLNIQQRKHGKSKYKSFKFYSVLIDVLSLFFISKKIHTLSITFKIIGFTITFCTFLTDIVLYILDIFTKFNIREIFLTEFIMINFFLVIGILIFLFGILFELNLHSTNITAYIVRKR